ncbi:hypothetical protein [Robertmurraya siralis]|uniref:hypothetical protein n=1 Tax=Robertmurraya siralis TaxID=77777 RepID=UPI0010F7F00D|nr:hypothetical protein [Robertmurraya siralis]
MTMKTFKKKLNVEDIAFTEIKIGNTIKSLDNENIMITNITTVKIEDGFVYIEGYGMPIDI